MRLETLRDRYNFLPTTKLSQHFDGYLTAIYNLFGQKELVKALIEVFQTSIAFLANPSFGLIAKVFEAVNFVPNL